MSYFKLIDDEYVQEGIKALWREALATRHIDSIKGIGEMVGSEIMLYWLMEEKEGLQRFLQIVTYARGSCEPTHKLVHLRKEDGTLVFDSSCGKCVNVKNGSKYLTAPEYTFPKD